MATTIGRAELARMIEGGRTQIRAHVQDLSKLDSVIGDGDHGTAMQRAMDAAAGALTKGAKLKDMLEAMSWDVMGIDGGSTGPLLGAFFMGMAGATGKGKALDAQGLAALFEAGLAGLRQQTKAQPGDKTMLDALVPAIAALKEGVQAGEDIPAALRRAAAAAEQGAASTAAMRAKFGRAKNYGDRAIGHEDPGARSMAYLFAGFAAAFGT